MVCKKIGNLEFIDLNKYSQKTIKLDSYKLVMLRQEQISI